MGKTATHSQYPYSTDLQGTAKEGLVGPPIGHVDIGISESAYLFRVALPGVRKDQCELSCEIGRDGKVSLRGVVTNGELATRNQNLGKNKYHMGVVQLSPPGPFNVSFKLPGPVDPRLFAPTYRSDGILEGVVMKYKKPVGEEPGF